MFPTLFDVIDTHFFTACIKADKPVRFVKFGDGEFACAAGQQGENCDGDQYFPELGDGLRRAFCDLAVTPNCYIGRWHLKDRYVSDFFEKVFNTNTQKSTELIPWVNYHCLLKDEERSHRQDMFYLVKAIQESPRKKIYVCNESNARLCRVFGATHVAIPPRCWITEYESVLKQILAACEPNSIVMFSAGLCTKVAVANLLQMIPTLTCLDFGSSFDLLARGKSTRSYQGSYETEKAYYKDLLPADWV